MLIYKGFFALLAATLLLSSSASAQDRLEPSAEPDFQDEEQAAEKLPLDTAAKKPVIISLGENINDFGRFADSGSDSNWYIGFNNAWIVKLPPAPRGEYGGAYLGARLGRAKSEPLRDRPWERSLIRGKVYVAVSQNPAFTSEQSFFLAETGDIPAQPDESVNIPGTGRSEWFWTKVPMSLISQEKPNYLIIWSPTRDFRDAQHSPILAGMDAPAGSAENEDPLAWNNHSIQGVPPRGESSSLQVPITNIRPALAIKLIPAGMRAAVRILRLEAVPSKEDTLVSFSVEGTDIDRAWVESSSDELDWRRVGPALHQPPYIFTFASGTFPDRGIYIRATASDFSGASGRSASLFVPARAEVRQ
ncbi:MAG: hypothetical protein WCU88_07600 [Elusimicrobiota bacterium]|jgi:hypothetical protein